LNQITTLKNRVVTLNNTVQAGNFSPAQVLDLVSYLDRLENVYKADRTTLRNNLETCLAATSDNVTTDCAPIINNTALNAFEYYDSTQPRANFFAQRNTLALQYVGKQSEFVMGSFIASAPLDVMYVDELPPSSQPVAKMIAGAAFVSFLDRPESTPLITITGLIANEQIEGLFGDTLAVTSFYLGLNGTVAADAGGDGGTATLAHRSSASPQDLTTRLSRAGKAVRRTASTITARAASSFRAARAMVEVLSRAATRWLCWGGAAAITPPPRSVSPTCPRW
jgi:hypothetical protein